MQFVIGLHLVLIGTWFRREAYHCLGRNFTFQLALRKDHRLVTDGVYSFVRHPSYTGLYSYGIGTLLCLFSPRSYWSEVIMRQWKLLGYLYCALCIALSVSSLISLIGRIEAEDFILRQEFTDQWDAWARGTRYKLVPYIY